MAHLALRLGPVAALLGLTPALLGRLRDLHEHAHRLLVLAQTPLGVHATKALDRLAVCLGVTLDAVSKLAQPHKPLRLEAFSGIGKVSSSELAARIRSSADRRASKSDVAPSA
jgi:hypothetical protein